MGARPPPAGQLWKTRPPPWWTTRMVPYLLHTPKPNFRVMSHRKVDLLSLFFDALAAAIFWRPLILAPCLLFGVCSKYGTSTCNDLFSPWQRRWQNILLFFFFLQIFLNWPKTKINFRTSQLSVVTLNRAETSPIDSSLGSESIPKISALYDSTKTRMPRRRCAATKFFRKYKI